MPTSLGRCTTWACDDCDRYPARFTQHVGGRSRALLSGGVTCAPRSGTDRGMQADPSTQVETGIRFTAERQGAHVVTVLARLAGHYRWARVPLGLALGVRVAIFLLGEVGARLLHLVPLAGPLGIWRKFDAVWYLHFPDDRSQ